MTCRGSEGLPLPGPGPPPGMGAGPPSRLTLGCPGASWQICLVQNLMYDHHSRASDLGGAVPTPSHVPEDTCRLGPGLEHLGVLTVLSAGLGDIPCVSRSPPLHAPCSAHAPATLRPRGRAGDLWGGGRQRHGPGSAVHMHSGREVLAKVTETRAQSRLGGQTGRPVHAGPAGARQALAVPQGARRRWACPTVLLLHPGPAHRGRGGSGTHASRSGGLVNTSGFPRKAREGSALRAKQTRDGHSLS